MSSIPSHSEIVLDLYAKSISDVDKLSTQLQIKSATPEQINKIKGLIYDVLSNSVLIKENYFTDSELKQIDEHLLTPLTNLEKIIRVNGKLDKENEESLINIKQVAQKVFKFISSGIRDTKYKVKNEICREKAIKFIELAFSKDLDADAIKHINRLIKVNNLKANTPIEVNNQTKTLLSTAYEYGKTEIVDLLLLKGAIPEPTDPDFIAFVFNSLKTGKIDDLEYLTKTMEYIFKNSPNREKFTNLTNKDGQSLLACAQAMSNPIKDRWDHQYDNLIDSLIHRLKNNGAN